MVNNLLPHQQPGNKERVSLLGAPGPARVLFILDKTQVQQLISLLATEKIINKKQVDDNLLKMLHEAAQLLEIPY